MTIKAEDQDVIVEATTIDATKAFLRWFAKDEDGFPPMKLSEVITTPESAFKAVLEYKEKVAKAKHCQPA